MVSMDGFSSTARGKTNSKGHESQRVLEKEKEIATINRLRLEKEDRKCQRKGRIPLTGRNIRHGK